MVSSRAFRKLVARGFGALAVLTLCLPLRAEPSADANKVRCAQAYENAQRARRAGELGRARAELVVCARTDCPSLLRPDCVTWLREVEAGMPSVVVSARAGGTDVVDASVRVDGQVVATRIDGKAITLDPGQHRVQVEAAGYSSAEPVVVVAEGEKLRQVVVELTPDHHEGSGQMGRLGPAVAFGAGAAVLLAAGVVVGSSARSEEEELDLCRPRCSPDEVDAVRSRYALANVLLGVGAAAGVVSLVFVVRRRPHAKASLDLGPTRAVITARF